VILMIVVPLAVAEVVITKSMKAAWGRLKHYQCLRRILGSHKSESDYIRWSDIKNDFSWGFVEGVSEFFYYCLVCILLLADTTEGLGKQFVKKNFVVEAICGEAPVTWARRRMLFALVMTVVTILASASTLGGYYAWLVLVVWA